MTLGRILYLQYTNPAGYPPLEHSSRFLADAGWCVRFLGTCAQGGANRMQFPPHTNIEVRLWPYYRPGIWQKLHYFAFGLWTFWTALAWRPRWLYASDQLSCPIALVLSFIPGLCVLYHEHDSPSTEMTKQTLTGHLKGSLDRQVQASGAQSPCPEHARRAPAFQRLVLSCRKKLARRAVACVLPNQARVEVFKAATGTTRPVLTIWNCPRKEEAKAAPKTGDGQLVRGPDKPFLVHYHGNVSRLLVPPALVNTVAGISGVRFRVVGYTTCGTDGYSEVIRGRAQSAGQMLELQPALPRCDLLALARTAHIGVALMPKDPDNLNLRYLLGASNKLFDYMACGLAVLVSDLPEWQSMCVEPGYGLACNPNDPASIAAALRWFVAHPEETRVMGERARQRILSDWNYETQFAAALRLINGGAQLQ